MAEVLLTAGVVCLIAAVVGGGLKAFGVEVAPLQSIGRQLLLAALGAGLLAGSYALQRSPPPLKTESNAVVPPPGDNLADKPPPPAATNSAQTDAGATTGAGPGALGPSEVNLLSQEIERGCIPFRLGHIALGDLPEGLRAKVTHHLEEVRDGGRGVKVIAATQLSYDPAYSTLAAERAAKAISDYLVSMGVPQSRLEVEWTRPTEDQTFEFPRLGTFDCLAYVRD